MYYARAFQQMNADPKPAPKEKKKPKPIPKESKKRKVENKEYKTLRLVYLENPQSAKLNSKDALKRLRKYTTMKAEE